MKAKPDKKPDNVVQCKSETANQSEQLNRFDWDFSAVYKADISEIIACCFYEYARESSSIMAHYNDGKQIESYSGGLNYFAKVNDIAVTLPNPFVWMWSQSLLGKLFLTPWQEMDLNWRTNVRNHYKENIFESNFPKAFTNGDSLWMKRDILSRGDERAGLDSETGRERIVVEIGWAAHTDIKIINSFRQWVRENRPEGVGKNSDKGRNKENGWNRKLHNLAIMRLLHHAPLSEWPERFPNAWKRYKPKMKGKHDPAGDDSEESQKRELYKSRTLARCNFHELFPFLPQGETPLSWTSKTGGVEM